jgi:GT2 family glycosyltransferase
MKVSVIIPTYQLVDLIYWHIHFHRFRNPPSYPIETIIVDGGSDEYIRNKLKVLEKSEIPNIKVIFVEGNKHDSYNMNAALKIAKGDFVVKLDSDVFITNKIFWENLLKTLENNPNALVGYAPTGTWTRGHGGLIGGYCMAWRKDIGFKWDEEYFGYGPSDMDFNMQFLEKGYPLILLEPNGLWHLGGIMGGMFYAKPKEQFVKENKRNHDIFFRKWEAKLPKLKGFL